MDTVWSEKRPDRPNEKVQTHPVQFSGKKSEEKIEELRKELEKKKSAGFIICRSQAFAEEALGLQMCSDAR